MWYQLAVLGAMEGLVGLSWAKVVGRAEVAHPTTEASFGCTAREPIVITVSKFQLQELGTSVMCFYP